MLDWSIFKALAENKINIGKTLKTVYGKVENIVGKGENAGYHHFLPFSQCFEQAYLLSVVRSWDRVVKS